MKKLPAVLCSLYDVFHLLSSTQFFYTGTTAYLAHPCFRPRGESEQAVGFNIYIHWKAGRTFCQGGVAASSPKTCWLPGAGGSTPFVRCRPAVRGPPFVLRLRTAHSQVGVLHLRLSTYLSAYC